LKYQQKTKGPKQNIRNRLILTRRVPIVEQELLTVPGYLCSSRVV